LYVIDNTRLENAGLPPASYGIFTSISTCTGYYPN
jgi:hypothetical protein